MVKLILLLMLALFAVDVFAQPIMEASGVIGNNPKANVMIGAAIIILINFLGLGGYFLWRRNFANAAT